MRNFPIPSITTTGLLAACMLASFGAASIGAASAKPQDPASGTDPVEAADDPAEDRMGVTETAGKKLASYFEAKTEFAALLQLALGGMTGSDDFRLVALNGPAYPVGSLIAAGNTLDLESRDCVVAEADLPRPDPWSGLPSWSSESALDVGLGLPSIWQSAISQNETSLDVGFEMDRQSYFQIEDISQVFLSRSELRRAFAVPACQAAMQEIPGAEVIYVRGLIYGRETLRSAKAFNAGVDLSLTGEDSGDFSFSFAKNGAFELKEQRLLPKFAVVTKLVLPAADRMNDRAVEYDPEPNFVRPSDQDLADL